MSLDPIDWLASLLLGWRERKNHALADHSAQVRKLVFGLSLDNAKERAERVLQQGGSFSVTRSHGSTRPELFQDLAPSLQQFFGAYERVQQTRGDARLDASVIGPSNVDRGYIRIGEDLDLAEVLVRPGDDRVFETEPGNRPALEAPSVWHWIVLLDALQRR
jgi:hypothetical protein